MFWLKTAVLRLCSLKAHEYVDMMFPNGQIVNLKRTEKSIERIFGNIRWPYILQVLVIV